MAYGNTPVQHAIPLDCISILHKLEQLTVRSSCSHSSWQTQGALSSLTSLHTFKFKGNAVLHGDIIASLSHLPSLAHLECSKIPRGRLDLGTGQFTALKSFSRRIEHDMEFQPVQIRMPAALNSQPLPGDTLGSLRSFCVHECVFTSDPVPFWQLSSLTSIEFGGCRFEPEGWLEQSLHGAVQIEELIMSDCELELDLCMSVCQLTNLKSLELDNNLFCDFPNAFSTLTALTMLDLGGNDLDTVPPSLQYLSKLQHVNLSICGSISSSLLFFVSFSDLQSITMASPWRWEGLSLYYISQLEAALEEHFAFDKRPSFRYW